MKKNKFLVISLIVCLLPLIAVIAVYHRLPETVVTHWGADGNPDGWSPRWLLFLLPVVLAAVQLLCHWATEHGDPRTAHTAHSLKKLVYWIIPAISVLATGVTLCAALEIDVPVAMIGQLLIGVLLIVLGNYLPKCRQNSVIGIRMPWTLSNVDNWNFTHRVAGRIWMIGGVVMLAAPFLGLVWLNGVILILIILATFGASLWYRLRHGK